MIGGEAFDAPVGGPLKEARMGEDISIAFHGRSIARQMPTLSAV